MGEDRRRGALPPGGTDRARGRPRARRPASGDRAGSRRRYRRSPPLPDRVCGPARGPEPCGLVCQGGTPPTGAAGSRGGSKRGAEARVVTLARSGAVRADIPEAPDRGAGNGCTSSSPGSVGVRASRRASIARSGSSIDSSTAASLPGGVERYGHLRPFRRDRDLGLQVMRRAPTRQLRAKEARKVSEPLTIEHVRELSSLKR